MESLNAGSALLCCRCPRTGTLNTPLGRQWIPQFIRMKNLGARTHHSSFSHGPTLVNSGSSCRLAGRVALAKSFFRNNECECLAGTSLVQTLYLLKEQLVFRMLKSSRFQSQQGEPQTRGLRWTRVPGAPFDRETWKRQMAQHWPCSRDPKGESYL